MDFFWTDEAEKQFRKYKTDIATQQTFRDLVLLIDENPDAGWRVDELVGKLTDAVAKRVAKAITGQAFPNPARIVIATIRGPKGALPPPWLAIVIHLHGVPTGKDGEHTLISMGCISRDVNAKFK